MKIPNAYKQEEDKHIHRYRPTTLDRKMIYDYAGYNFEQQEDLGLLVFYSLLRDSFIYTHSQSEKGNEYLDDCWLMEQTKADRSGLRQLKNDMEGGRL